MSQRNDSLRKEDTLTPGLGRPLRVKSGVQGVNKKGLR